MNEILTKQAVKEIKFFIQHYSHDPKKKDGVVSYRLYNTGTRVLFYKGDLK